MEDLAIEFNYVTHKEEEMDKEINRTCKKMFEIQRNLTILPLQNLNIGISPFISNPKLFFDYLSQRANLSTDLDHLHVHYISKLLDYFLENIDSLTLITQVAFKGLDKSTFKFFVTSTIPSLFGYFICHENLLFAYSFYTKIITKVPKHVAYEILEPYFCNACTFNYIEAITSDVLHFFCQDVRLSTLSNNLQIIIEHENGFVESALKYLNLLPKSHLNTLIMMKKSGFDDEEVFKFIINHCILPQISYTFKASALSHHYDLFQKMVNHMFSTHHEYQFSKLFNTKSSFVIPTAFSDFNHNYLRLIITPLDAALLATVSKGVIQFPEELASLEKPNYLTGQNYHPFIVKVHILKKVNPLLMDNDPNVLFPKHNINQKQCNNRVFDKIYLFFVSIAKKYGLSFNDLLEGKYNKNMVKESYLINHFKNKTDVDYTGICDDCTKLRLADKKATLCENCIPLENEQKITFYDYLKIKTEMEEIKVEKEIENLLNYTLAFKRMKKWSKIIKRFYKTSLISVTQDYITLYFENLQSSSVNFEKFVNNYGKLFNFPESQMLFYINYLATALPSIEQNKHKEFRLLENRWCLLLDSLVDINIPKSFTDKSLSQNKKLLLNCRFMKASSALNNINLSPFYKSYSCIISCLRQIKYLSAFDNYSYNLLKYSIKISKGGNLLTKVLEISALIAKEPKFLEKCNNDDIFLWNQLESVIFELFKNDEEIQSMYNNLFNYVESSLISV